MQNLADVRAAFIDPEGFWSSPLYRRLSSVVAANPFLVEVAANARAGQGPTFAFFGAVHALLLSGTDHDVADYYPSVRGESARPPDEDAGAALTAFVHEHAERIGRLLQSRLVRTNHVQRAVGLRLTSRRRRTDRRRTGAPARDRQQRRPCAPTRPLRLPTRPPALW